MDSNALDGLAAEIVRSNQTRRSWRERLGWVAEVLADARRTVTRRDLVDIAVYLRFLATGEVACVEDGHHYRPSHHAKASREIFRRLEKLATADATLVLRKIYPWLPAFGPQFVRKEPLTRIRDIAHRNDIPQELKREIKHTLQNKLHRCAGPEDLATSAALLERITSPEASYPESFVEQFEIFHQELKAFFSARSLGEQLAAVAERCDDEQLRTLIDRRVLPRLEPENPDLTGRAGGEGPAKLLLERLGDLTRLRELLLGQLDGADEVWRQQCRLADIAAEQQVFVLASELNNLIGEARGECWVWQAAVEALKLALVNLGASGVAPGECDAVATDLAYLTRGEATRRHAEVPGREELLWLRAALQRCRRLAGEQTDVVLQLFAARVDVLGRALDVPSHAVQSFCEADLRANVLFQLTRLVDDLDLRIRRAAGLSSWVPIVSGSASGELLALPRLATESAGPSRSIVLVEHVEGDETIPEHVRGLIVAHEVPQLSHLAVRARQRGIPFAACDSREEIGTTRALDGRPVTLEVNEEGVRVQTGGGDDGAPQARSSVGVSLPRRDPEQVDALIAALMELPPEATGAKAAGLVRLAALAGEPAALFSVPETLVVPLGAMEAAMQRQPPLWKTYQRLVQRAGDVSSDELPAICEQLRSVIRRVDVPPEIGSTVLDVFAPSERLIVRSSANCEDLDRLSGAGLYDSVANVPPSRVALAVRSVWASLWSERAARSRRADGIAATEAQMAVIVQRMVLPDVSFFLHTTHPLSADEGEAYVELAAGLGDTLAAATRGTPFRWTCDKQRGTVSIVAFPSLSEGLFPDAAGGLERRVIRYAELPLVCDKGRREALGSALSTIAVQLEQALGLPQDVEGVVAQEQIFLVQARPQQGLAARPHATGSDAGGDAKQPQRSAAVPPPASGASEQTDNVAVARVQGASHQATDGMPLELLSVLLLFEKRIEGDDTLLRLASLRCAQSDLGLEVHPGGPDHLDQLLRFRPSDTSVVVAHLPRHIDLLRGEDRDWIAALAARAEGRVRGMVVHDQRQAVDQPRAYREAVTRLADRLGAIAGAPLLFIEYAVGLAPDQFIELFEDLAELQQVSACIDSGHVGIRQLRRAFGDEHPDRDPCALTPYDPDLSDLLPALERARQSCLPVLLDVVRALVRLGKPLHFHLHDGHPLWTLSPFGVSDHVSFLETVSIPFSYAGKRTLELMFGSAGLAQIVDAARQLSDPSLLSMTLEIHPVPGRMPLADEAAAGLFAHWRDTDNAERMNYWLAVMQANARAIRCRSDAC